MKTIVGAVTKLFKIIISLITFGLVSFNNKVEKDFSIELLKSKLADLKYSRKESNDRYIHIKQEEAVMRENINKDKDKLSQIKKELVTSKKENNVDKFNLLALEFTSVEEVKKEHESALVSLTKAADVMKTTLDNMNQSISTMEIKIKNLEAKKATYETIKGVNEVLGTTDGELGDSAIDTDSIAEQIEQDVTREMTKADILGTSTMTKKPVRYSSKESMDSFLKEHGIK